MDMNRFQYFRYNSDVMRVWRIFVKEVKDGKPVMSRQYREYLRWKRTILDGSPYIAYETMSQWKDQTSSSPKMTQLLFDFCETSVQGAK